MYVINMFGGPGSGKSTTAAGLFHLMKLKKYNVELVTEYAKDLTYEGRFTTLKNQLYVTGCQFQRMERMRDKVDFLITDSPMLFGLMYAPPEYPQSFRNMVVDFHNMFNNINVMIGRSKEYTPLGRNHNEEQARWLDKECLEILHHKKIRPGNYIKVDGDPDAAANILKAVEAKKL